MSQVNRPAHRTFGLLNLESLEVREVPAAYYWSPVDSQLLSSNPNNWLVGPGIPYALATEAPNYDDDLHFGWDTEGNQDCYIGPTNAAIPIDPPPSSVNTFHGIYLEAEYTHRVTFLLSVSVNVFDMAGGKIRQADTHLMPTSPGGGLPPPGGGSPGSTSGTTTLTVADTFHWTDGTINDGDLLGKLDLAPGATGLAEPTDGGTVELGSTITLQGNQATQLGSTLEVRDGTYNLNRGASLHTTAYCVLNLAPLPLGKGVITVNDKEGVPNQEGLIEVNADSKAFVRPITRPPGSTKNVDVKMTGVRPGIQNSGITEVSSFTTLQIIPDKDNDPETDDGKGEYLHTATLGQADKAITRLEAGSAIIGKHDTTVDIGVGKLELVPVNLNGTTLSDQPYAIISSEEAVFALSIGVGATLTKKAGETAYVPLKVEGKLVCGGSIEMAMDRASTACDSIRVTSTIGFNQNTARVKLHWTDPNTNTVIGVDGEWKLISSDDAEDGILSKPGFDLPADNIITTDFDRKDGVKRLAAWRKS